MNARAHPIQVRSCRVCGCTDDRACVTSEGPCSWLSDDDDLCSACFAAFGHVVTYQARSLAGLRIRYAVCSCGGFDLAMPKSTPHANDKAVRRHWQLVVQRARALECT